MVRPLAKPGRETRHAATTLELPSDVEIPTCDHCGAEWYDDTMAREVDKVLAAELERRAMHALRGDTVGRDLHTVCDELDAKRPKDG
jgi:hypothetical protein